MTTATNRTNNNRIFLVLKFNAFFFIVFPPWKSRNSNSLKFKGFNFMTFVTNRGKHFSVWCCPCLCTSPLCHSSAESFIIRLYSIIFAECIFAIDICNSFMTGQHIMQSFSSFTWYLLNSSLYSLPFHIPDCVFLIS